MTEELTEVDRIREIQKLQHEKVKLLDKYGLFGGGEAINLLHEGINNKLKALGYSEYD